LDRRISIPDYSTSNGYNYNRQKEALPTDKVSMFWIPDQEYISFVGSETLPSICYILMGSETLPPACRVGNASFYLFHTFRRI